MSFLSNLGSILSDSAKAVSSWIPGASAFVNPITGVIDNAINKYESQKATDRAYNFQQSMLDQQQAFNAEQSQLNRDFQAEQSSIQNEFNASEAQKAREWNSEQSVLARQLAAGINPLAGDLSSGSNAVAQSAGLPEGFAAQSGLVGAPSSAINPSLQASQMALLDAQRSKIETETDSEKTKQKYLDGIYQNELDLGNVNIHLGLQNERLSKAEEEKVIAETKNVKAEFDNIQAGLQQIRELTKGMSLDNVMKAFENEHIIEKFTEYLRNMKSSTALNLANVDKAKAEAKLILQQFANAVIEGGNLAFDFKLNKDSYQNDLRVRRYAGYQAMLNYDASLLEYDLRSKYGSPAQKLKFATEIAKGVGSVVVPLAVAWFLKGKGSGNTFNIGSNNPVSGPYLPNQ